MYQLVFSDRARNDIGNIWEFIATQSLVNADRILDLIESKCSLLADNPKLGRARPELGNGMRWLVIDRWNAYYRFDGDTIRIIRILDGARDLRNIDWPTE